MNFLTGRIQEPSSHAGLAVLLQALKSVVSAEWHSLIDAVTVFFCGTAIAIPELKKPE